MAGKLSYAHVFGVTQDPSEPEQWSDEDYLNFQKSMKSVHRRMKSELSLVLSQKVRHHASKHNVLLDSTTDVLALHQSLIQRLPVFQDDDIHFDNLKVILGSIKGFYKFELDWVNEVEQTVERECGIRIQKEGGKSIFYDMLSSMCDSYCQKTKKTMIDSCGAVWYDTKSWKDPFGEGVIFEDQFCQVPIRLSHTTHLVKGYLLYITGSSNIGGGLSRSVEYQVGQFVMNCVSRCTNYNEFESESRAILGSVWNNNASEIQVSDVSFAKSIVFVSNTHVKPFFLYSLPIRRVKFLVLNLGILTFKL